MSTVIEVWAARGTEEGLDPTWRGQRGIPGEGRCKLKNELQDSPGCEVFPPRVHGGQSQKQKAGHRMHILTAEWEVSEYS